MLKINIIDKKQFWIIFTRLFGILSRYIFILVFGKILNKEIFSDFNLVSSLVIYLIFFAGFDYYNHLHRNYYNNRNLFLKFLNNYFFLLFFTLLFGNLLSYFFLKNYDNNYIICLLVFIINITELFLQETYRFEILKGKVINANIFSFLRYIWMLIYIVNLLVFNNKMNFLSLLFYWAFINSLISALIFFIYYNFKGKIRFSLLNIRELMNSLKSIFPLFISTLIFRAIFLLDRWIPQFLGSNKEEISKYSLLAILASGFTIFVDAIYVNFYYHLLMKYKESDEILYKKTVKTFFKKVLYFSILIFVITSFILLFINKITYGVYSFSRNLILLTVLSQIFYNLSIIPNLILFNIKKDYMILFTNIFSLIIFIFSLLICFIYFKSLTATVVFTALTFAFFALFIFKTKIASNYGYKIY
jgi:O-antigen/teichoic acid export membrane protein